MLFKHIFHYIASRGGSYEDRNVGGAGSRQGNTGD